MVFNKTVFFFIKSVIILHSNFQLTFNNQYMHMPALTQTLSVKNQVLLHRALIA